MTASGHSTDAVTFALATPVDEAILEVLFRDAFSDYLLRLGRNAKGHDYAWLGSALTDGRVWQATLDKRPVGAIAVIPDGKTWLLDLIVVSPPEQGRGIGSRMLQDIERIALDAGIRRLTLDTVKLRDDLVGMYQRRGFQIYGEGLPSHGRDDNLRVFMEKHLD